jgi:hypothetical protein
MRRFLAVISYARAFFDALATHLLEMQVTINDLRRETKKEKRRRQAFHRRKLQKPY